jgi:hypothetical protein
MAQNYSYIQRFSERSIGYVVFGLMFYRMAGVCNKNTVITVACTECSVTPLSYIKRFTAPPPTLSPFPSPMCDNFDNFLRRLCIAFAMSSTFLNGYNSPFSRSLASEILSSWSGIFKDDFDCGSYAHPPSLTPSFPIPDAWLTLDTSYHSLFLQARGQEIWETRPLGFLFCTVCEHSFVL